jgi:hypothetical protein
VVAEFRRQSSEVMDELRVQIDQDEKRARTPEPAAPDGERESRDG